MTAQPYLSPERASLTGGFWSELRRRKVYRVAAAYVMSGGFIMQLASAIFPAWELPFWSLRLVIAVILAGFPLALILAWAFDVTPAGLERTPPTLAPGQTGSAYLRRNIILLTSLGLAGSIIAGFFLWPRTSARPLEKSVAVLPFENLSSDPENAYFADGIQDDVRTALSKISDLRVISRTSVMPFRGQTKNMREIAKLLDVATVVEGTVRRSGNRVRVNVQLINAVDDHQIWSQEYDRDLYDMISLQSELAQKISDELHARLLPTEKVQLERRPTENAEAYVAYVQAHHLHNNWENFEKLQQAEQLYERALQLDPEFPLALAQLSGLQSWIFHEHDAAPARRERARELAYRALELQPDLPEAHLALGYCLYYVSTDYEAAMREFEFAQRGLPNCSEVCLSLAAVQRRLGRWNESTSNWLHAVSLNPNQSWPLQNVSSNYQRTRNFPAALATVDKALTITPDVLALWGLKASYTLAATGDFSAYPEAMAAVDAAQPGIEKERFIVEIQIQGLMQQRKYRELLPIAERIDDTILSRASSLFAKYFAIGVARHALQDEAGARAALLKAKASAEMMSQGIGAFVQANGHAKLGLVCAFLGEKESAIAHGIRATELLPENKDVFEGPEMTEMLAEIYATVGEQERAIDLLERLLHRPSQITVPMLKIQPIWDPLRKHPRFIKLVERPDA
jgi:TolB-like protein